MNRPPLIRLNQAWATPILDGVFAELANHSVPWNGSIDAHLLDMDYHYNISGNKIISGVVGQLLENDELAQTSKVTLASLIYSLYGNRWNHLWETMELQYNPIENYSMTETMTDDETIKQYGSTITRTDNLTHGKTGTETDTPNTTETQTGNTTQDTDRDISAFNSADYSPYQNETTTNTGTITKALTGNAQKTYNLSDTDSGTQTNAQTGTDRQTRNYSLMRSGNIGVTTSQQMIESERNLWQWDFIRSIVYPDIDRIITISIY